MTAPLQADASLLGQILERVPVGRLGEPEDVVGPVAFLLSDASAMITGHLLPIDGGVSEIVSRARARGRDVISPGKRGWRFTSDEDE